MGSVTTGAVLSLTLMLAGGGAWAGEPPPPKPPLEVGQTAPRFRLATMNPEESGQAVFSVKRHVGSAATAPLRALMLSFGASHCGPCKRELPALKALAARYRDRGVGFAVVVIDEEPEGIEVMRKFTVEELGLTIPVVSDRFAIVARRYGASLLPLNVIIGADGTVTWTHAGFAVGTLDAAEVELSARAKPAPETPPPPPSPKP